MGVNRWVLLLTLAAAVGCESGWDVRVQVLTAGVSDKARPLFLYVVDQPAIDPGKLPAETFQFEPFVQLDTVPSGSQRFEKREFGCHRGAVMVVAWVPAAAMAVPPPRKPFEPAAGDLVAFSAVHVPYCGLQTKWEDITLSIDDSNIRR